ncbi:MAG: AraC family transcriptional regulator, arabinose operon regulatory protein [Chloroflexota bacterium]|nr:AraC family transcriptional regulator, arabinose operon regulatory protein [Chloroflexota bacterium]
MALAAVDMHDPATPAPVALADTPAPRPGLLVADLFSQGPAYRSRRRAGTRDWLLTFTIGGRGRYRCAGQEFGCAAGDVMLLQPGTPHDYGTDGAAGQWDFYWVHFLPRPAWAAWLLWAEVTPGLRHVSVADAAGQARLAAVFDRLLCDAVGPEPWGEQLAENALEEVILLITQAHGRAADRPLDGRVAHVLQEINRRYREPLTVAELAAAVHLSPSRLAHLFRAATGEAPIQMLLRLRLRQAARLLEYSTLNVAEIAAEIGFDSPFYFARLFRRQFGISPTAYRAQPLTTKTRSH